MKIDRKINKVMDFPPHHFLRFSSKSLHSCFEILNFFEIVIKFTPIKLNESASCIQILLTGKLINKLIKKKVVHSEYTFNGTLLSDKVTLWRKILFYSLKNIRNILFIFPYFYLKKFDQGSHLYFYAKLEGI